MKIKTHNQIDQNICGEPISLKEGHCIVKLKTNDDMKVDKSGLIHGGFIFGAADYAAMLAVNHPNVVLGSASFDFKKPVSVSDSIYAEANLLGESNGKKVVKVKVRKNSQDSKEIIGIGQFTCFILKQHILEDKKDE